MQIISIKKLREFFEAYPDPEQAIKSWKKLAKDADCGVRVMRLSNNTEMLVLLVIIGWYLIFAGISIGL